MYRRLGPLMLVSAMLVLAACAAPGGPGGGEPVSLAGTQWQLREVSGTPVATEAWIGFEPGGRVGGNAGCNQFGGNYARDGDDLTFNDINATLMACLEPQRMETERAFVSALQATREATGSEDLLQLRDGRGNIVATLTRRA